MAEPTLESLRADLAALLRSIPEMPQPYDPHSPEGRAYYQARADWSDCRRRLEHEIWKLETPKTQPQDRQPRHPSRAYPQAPARFRA